MAVADNNEPSASDFIKNLSVTIPQYNVIFYAGVEYYIPRCRTRNLPVNVHMWLLNSSYIPDHEHCVYPVGYFRNYELNHPNYKRLVVETECAVAKDNTNVLLWRTPPIKHAPPESVTAVLLTTPNTEYPKPLLLHPLSPQEQRPSNEGYIRTTPIIIGLCGPPYVK